MINKLDIENIRDATKATPVAGAHLLTEKINELCEAYNKLEKKYENAFQEGYDQAIKDSGR